MKMYRQSLLGGRMSIIKYVWSKGYILRMSDILVDWNLILRIFKMRFCK